MSGLANLLSCDLHARVDADPLWRRYLANLDPLASRAPFGVHLAILIEPYLEHVLAGRKTVEARFSVRAQAPYRAVSTGDVVLLKRSGGPVVGLCRVTDAWFYRLDPATWSSIRRDFTEQLCAQDPAFWEARAGADYATLLRIGDVRRIPALPCDKRDRRGWVVLRQRDLQATLGFVTPPVLLFSGPIGSGKTHLARAVADELGWSCVGFSDEVRRVAALRGLRDDRATLADVGASLVRDQPNSFCRAVLARATWVPGQPIVVHGLRHVSILTEMRAIVAPVPVKHIHVLVPPEIRNDRMRRRGESDPRILDTHSTERDVGETLPKIADLVVDGAVPVATNAARVLGWLQTVSPLP